MKLNKLISFFLIINLIKISIIQSKKKSYLNLIRNLWEQNMEYESRDNEDDNKSLKNCAKSSYKYFSYILSGAPVDFLHYINSGNAVRTN